MTNLTIKEYNFLRGYTIRYAYESFKDNNLKGYTYWFDFIFSIALQKYVDYKEKNTYFNNNIKIQKAIIKKTCRHALLDFYKKGDFRFTTKVEDIDKEKYQKDIIEDLIDIELKENLRNIYQTFSKEEKRFLNCVIIEPKKSIKAILEKYNIDSNIYKNVYNKMKECISFYNSIH